MTIRMRLTSLLAASVLAASAGLVTGFVASPAGAQPVGPGDEQACTVSCGDDEPDGPSDHQGADDFEVCTEGCSSHPDDPDEETGDVPIPADANFTG